MPLNITDAEIVEISDQQWDEDGSCRPEERRIPKVRSKQLEEVWKVDGDRPGLQAQDSTALDQCRANL